MAKNLRIPKLSVEDVHEETGLSKPTIRRLISTGQLRAYRAGRSIRVHEDDLAALFEEIPTA